MKIIDLLHGTKENDALQVNVKQALATIMQCQTNQSTNECVAMLLRNITTSTFAIISNNNEVYEEPVPMTERIPLYAVELKSSEANMKQECLY